MLGVDVLRILGLAAAELLLLELLVVLIIFLAIAGGLAFGLRWVRGKTDWAFGKVNTYVPIGVRYIHQATDYAALPVIKLGGFAEATKATAQGIRARIQALRAAKNPPQIEPSRPVASAPAAETATPEGVAPLT